MYVTLKAKLCNLEHEIPLSFGNYHVDNVQLANFLFVNMTLVKFVFHTFDLLVFSVVFAGVKCEVCGLLLGCCTKATYLLSFAFLRFIKKLFRHPEDLY